MKAGGKRALALVKYVEEDGEAKEEFSQCRGEHPVDGAAV